MGLVKSSMSTSTTTITCSNEVTKGKSTKDSSAKEVGLTMLRTQQSPATYVCQTAPQSPSKLTPMTSPTSSWKPHMGRAGSPERVKSSLKLRPGLKRANSEPSQKNVHFSTTNLVDVRQFKRGQRPSAVSQKPKFYNPPGDDGDSSVDADEDEDDEDICDTEDEEDDIYYHANRRRAIVKDKRAEDSSKGWALLTPGFVPRSYSRLAGSERPMCYTDTLQLSSSQSILIAAIFVRNVAFQKYVAVRYSLNDWETFTEVQGSFSTDVRKFDRDNGYDRFDVKIPLNRFDAFELNVSTLKFCVHYVANGEEFWDNNRGKNYEIYLRNSQLKPSGGSVRARNWLSNGSASQASVSKGHQSGDRMTEESILRRRAGSEPDMALRIRGGSTFADEYNEDYGDDGSISGKGALYGSGITFRESLGAQDRDPFVHRYSFESAYAAPPKSASRVAPNISDLTLAEKELTPSSREPSPTKVSGSSKTLLAAEHDAGPKQAPTQPNSWESESYKELVSKYCFYTPQCSAQPIAPSRQLSPQERSSSEELLEHSIGPHPGTAAASIRKAAV